eukprot:5714089-Pleurochrysis_carterae.AAC.1
MVARSCMFRPNIELEVRERVGAIRDFVEKQRPRLIAKQQTEAELVIIYFPTTSEVDKARARARVALIVRSERALIVRSERALIV